jgi:hypothetical protein
MTNKTAKSEQPLVGIFWLVGGRLILDTSPLREAEPYGDCLGHRASHHQCWAKLQVAGVIGPDLEYDDFPRGRVTANAKTNKFFLLLDRCIRNDKGKVAKIMMSMHLPKDTIIDTDLHYRCPTCLDGQNPLDDCSRP